MIDQIISDLRSSHTAARLARPDVPDSDLIFGPNAKPQSIDEFNASGEEMVFVCRPVDGRDFGCDEIISGSTIVRCAGCELNVWISPATLNLWRRLEKRRILCPTCAMKEPKK